MHKSVLHLLAAELVTGLGKSQIWVKARGNNCDTVDDIHPALPIIRNHTTIPIA